MRRSRYRAVCVGFQWIGQPLYSCDRCGNPQWFHSHEEVFRAGRTFRRIISADVRNACREKWEATMLHESYTPPSLIESDPS